MKGILHIQPAEFWRGLPDDQKKFLQKYNAAIRHGETPPQPPAGVSIGTPKDNGNGNSDLGKSHYNNTNSGKRRVRRAKAT